MGRNKTTYKKITKEDKGRLFIELPKKYIIKNLIIKENEDIFRITKLEKHEVPKRWIKKRK